MLVLERVVGIDGGCYFVEERVEVGPAVGLLFGEDEGVIECDLKGADLRVDDVLIGVGIDVLVLWYFEGDEIVGYHVADDLELRVSLCDHF